VIGSGPIALGLRIRTHIFYKTSWTKGLAKRSVVNLDPHHFSNLDPHPDPHPDPHQFADVKPKCMEYAPILALFEGFEPFLKLRSGSGSASG